MTLKDKLEIVSRDSLGSSRCHRAAAFATSGWPPTAAASRAPHLTMKRSPLRSGSRAAIDADASGFFRVRGELWRANSHSAITPAQT